MTHLTKVWKLSIFTAAAFVLAVMIFFVLYQFDNYMFGWEASLYWGRTPFVARHFREAETNEKSTMVADLISKKYFIGKSIENVKLKLGPSTGGYYNSDVNLAYTVRIDGKTIWDIVFVVNQSTNKVTRLLIYKRRGGLTRKILGTFMQFIDGWQ